MRGNIATSIRYCATMADDNRQDGAAPSRGTTKNVVSSSPRKRKRVESSTTSTSSLPATGLD
eukprot:scaffold154837_cov58-Attheya_sp.AAC.1